MSNIQRYYYDDQDFQLELNLHCIRRELVKLLDHETSDCYTCNRIKCRCHDDMTGSWISWNHTDNEPEIRSPRPELLPTPEWTTLRSIENWIRGSVPEFAFQNSLSYPVSKNAREVSSQSWPPYPKSIWNDEQKENRLKKKSKETGSVGSVEDFFQYFTKKMLQND